MSDLFYKDYYVGPKHKSKLRRVAKQKQAWPTRQDEVLANRRRTKEF